MRITVLTGSTLSATAVGRPDRSAQLSGVLHGTVPWRLEPSTDVGVDRVTAIVTLLVLLYVLPLVRAATEAEFWRGLAPAATLVVWGWSSAVGCALAILLSLGPAVLIRVIAPEAA